jgi:hypothetical protein
VLAPVLAALALAAACSDRAPPPPGAGPPPGAWRTFEGTWSAAGERRTLDLGPDRQASVLDLSGALVLAGEGGLGAGFQARALAFSDGRETGVGSAVWTDERGDHVYSELRGAPIAAGRRVVGTITGGTGRWTGITGEYGFEWTWVVETDGRLQGRTVGLRGRARVAGPGSVTR